MKNSAEVVIIGGGVIGCSIAYNLAKEGRLNGQAAFFFEDVSTSIGGS